MLGVTFAALWWAKSAISDMDQSLAGWDQEASSGGIGMLHGFHFHTRECVQEMFAVTFGEHAVI